MASDVFTPQRIFRQIATLIQGKVHLNPDVWWSNYHFFGVNSIGFSGWTAILHGKTAMFSWFPDSTGARLPRLRRFAAQRFAVATSSAKCGGSQGWFGWREIILTWDINLGKYCYILMINIFILIYNMFIMIYKIFIIIYITTSYHLH